MAAQREWFEKDYYKILGVAKTATQKEITSAYRKLAKKLHPDANPDDKAAEEKFKEVSAAYDVLGEEKSRKEYDEVRAVGPAGGFGGFGAGGATAGGVRFEASDLGDLFGDLFSRARSGGGAGGPGGFGSARATRGERGADLEVDLNLSFVDAIEGIETTIQVVSDAVCDTCKGSGAAPGTQPVICGHCGGKGSFDDNQGVFGFSRPCQHCRGTGYVVETPCGDCGGTGTRRRPRRIKVRVPAGTADGQRLRLKQRGTPGRNGGPQGDLYVTVHVGKDHRFGRKGDDLILNLPVSFHEAVFGAEVKVPTLADPVTLRIPAGTASGRVFRVRGRGVQTAKRTGDLLVTVQVAVPKNLSDEQADAIRAYAQSDSSNPRSHLGV